MSKTMKILAVGVVTTLIVSAIIAIVAVRGSGTHDSVAESGPVEAVCVINGGPQNRVVSGTLNIRQDNPNAPVTLHGSIKGFTPSSSHGFHVHASGDFRNEENSCVSCGPHFNPHKKTHGGPGDSNRHVGDLGNINADSSGIAAIDITDSVVSLVPGHINNIVGRAIVVHEKQDDLGTDGGDSLNTGNAGARLGCCIIGLVQPKSP